MTDAEQRVLMTATEGEESVVSRESGFLELRIDAKVRDEDEHGLPKTDCWRCCHSRAKQAQAGNLEA